MRDVAAALAPIVFRILVTILLFWFFSPIAFRDDLHWATKWLILAGAAAVPSVGLGLWDRHNAGQFRSRTTYQPSQEERDKALDEYVESVKAKRQQQQKPA